MATRLLLSGNYTLKVVSASNTQPTVLEQHTGVKCNATSVPYIVAPRNANIEGKSAYQLIGKSIMIVDNSHNKSTYGIVADVGNSNNNWTTISTKCAIDLGFLPSQIKSSKISSNFTIYIELDNNVKYHKQMRVAELTTAIKSSGAANFGNQVCIQDSANNPTAYNYAQSGYTKKEDIDWSYLNYFIMTIDRNVLNVDYTKLRKHKVSGVIIEAGYLYNSIHQIVPYRNPNLKTQCLLASKSKMSWGLYCECRARSDTEAKQELKELAFCIRKYPPVLGLWVHFSLVKSLAINDNIVDTYKKELVRLGLKGKIGIIANEAELKCISWKTKHYKDWILWINKPVSNLSDIEQLLDPQFFSV